MDIFNKIGEYLVKTQQDEIDQLLKNENDLPQNPMESASGKPIGQKAILEDPYFDNHGTNTIYRHKMSRLSNKTLKDVSLRDWLVSAIIQIRVDTIQRFTRPQDKKFDFGFRFLKRDKNEDYTDEDRKNIHNLESFIYNCGRTDHISDSDKMLFGTFVKKVVRDALTFGYVTIEKTPTRRGALHRIRPVPAEQMYLINKNYDKKTVESFMGQVETMYRPTSDNDPDLEKEFNHAELDYYKYVQTSIDMRPMRAFGDEDMIFKTFNPQNFMDTLGYDYGPLEMAIVNITNHLNAENYNSNFFTHGYAARGILHLKGNVTPAQLTAFRRQFFNTINSTHNAWRTPIVAGLDEVGWIPMSGSSRDMEYINFNNHLMRAICTQFQIDPIELGLDFLTSPTGRATSANQQGNKQKIEYSRERGLYPILMFLEDMINCDIVPKIDQDLANKYVFRFEGLTDETPQTEITLLQAEMTVNKSMNDLLRSARKDKIDHPIAELPMNAVFWQQANSNMTKGEIREFFFGDKGASERKELQYFPGDPLFLQWQTFLNQLNMMKKQEEQQNEQMQMQQQQMQMQQQQSSREQEMHDAQKNAMDHHAANTAVAQNTPFHEAAKDAGLTRAQNVGGKPTKNPLNQGQE